MRWLRRTKEANILTDYSRVADAVHLRRAATDSQTSREVSVESLRAARSYRPAERLEEVTEQTREFVEDSKQTPRTFGKDWIPPLRLEHDKDVKPETLVKVFLTANLFAGAWLLTARFLGIRFGDLLVVWCAVIASALQVGVSLQCWERSPRLCAAGVLVGLIVGAFGCEFLVGHEW